MNRHPLVSSEVVRPWGKKMVAQGAPPRIKKLNTRLFQRNLKKAYEPAIKSHVTSASSPRLQPGRLRLVVERLWTAGRAGLLRHYQHSNRLRRSTDNPYQPLPAGLIRRPHWSRCHRAPDAKCPVLSTPLLNHS